MENTHTLKEQAILLFCGEICTSKRTNFSLSAFQYESEFREFRLHSSVWCAAFQYESEFWEFWLHSIMSISAFQFESEFMEFRLYSIMSVCVSV